MPQDSTYVILDNGDTFYMPTQPKTGDNTTYSSGNAGQTENGENDIDVFPWIFLIIGAILAYNYLTSKKGEVDFSSTLKLPTHSQDPKWFHYHDLLSRKNPYYHKLPKELQRKFLIRLTHFMKGKKFSFIEMQPNEDCMVLIGAVAIQITFGLEEFEMSYFRNIYVMRTNYHFGLSPVPYEGHVSSMGIYLSWHNFEISFTDYCDGNNLGLHEMAHALAYVNFTARKGADDYFRKRFKKFSKTGRRILADMQNGKPNMLGSYAATNYHEFWAVCIENFFERPELLKKELPDLYTELTLLLKQDPTSDNLLINNV